MKKIVLFLALFLPLLFASCDVNFGLQSVNNVYLIIEGVTDSNISVFCESEKLHFSKKTECREIISEIAYNSFVKDGLINDNYPNKLFHIISNRYEYFDDHKNVVVSFTVNISGEIYKGVLNIPTLRTKSGKHIDSVRFELKADSGKVIPAVFTFHLDMSI
mgnify:CR=1 FL=1